VNNTSGILTKSVFRKTDQRNFDLATRQHESSNVCPQDYWHLSEAARPTLRGMRRRQWLITAFWKQSSLWPE
jgi:hypothetical protein